MTELSTLFQRVDSSQVDALIALLAGKKRLFVAGAGRSGLVLRCFAMRVMHLGKPVHMVGDVTTPAAQPGDVLLIGSGSGETASLVAMATKAADTGLTTAIITTNPQSSIARRADLTVVIPGPTPKNRDRVNAAVSLQPMGTLFEQGMFLLLDSVVIRLMGHGGITEEEMFGRHANLE